MRSTLDIDGKLLTEALKISGAKTKKEVINLTLEEYIRHAKLDRLKKRYSGNPILMTQKLLNKLRKDG